MTGSVLVGIEFGRWQASPPAVTTTTYTATVASASIETLTRTTTSSETVTRGTSDLEFTLFADWHGDGKQQSDEPNIKDLQVDVSEIPGNFLNTIVAGSDGKYWMRNVQVGKKYVILPRTDRFKYISVSNSEIRDITEGYIFQVQSPDDLLSVGLMEGFLTLPIMSGTRYEIDRYYDRDPDPDKYLWWNGTHGYDRNMKRGSSPNHPGIDYYLEEGNPLPSPAPGRVRAVVEDDPGGKFVLIDHLNGFLTRAGISQRRQSIKETAFREDRPSQYLEKAGKPQRKLTTLTTTSK